MKTDKILLGHGSGGKLTHELIDNLFLKELGNEISRRKGDSAIMKMGNRRLAFTTDSYVVNPIFFPGGDIGSLSIFGTVNDLSVCGARPLYIAVGMIIEEGLDKDVLVKITRSIKDALRVSGVKLVTGDVKVVEKGSCDRLFINTSGIGEVYCDSLSIDRVKVGDSILISGPIGDHAISVLSKREGISFGSKVKSDSAPLNHLIAKVLKVSRNVKFMRDPTRGGLATTLNEITGKRSFGILIDEEKIPVRPGVIEACELLGFDPLYLACEGRVIVIVAQEDEGKVLAAMRRDKVGLGAAMIGKVVSDYSGKVCVKTISGGKRIADMLTGEQLPRIC